MNPQLRHLYEIAGKKERMIVGLMSGTSLDGLDVALCCIRGNGKDTQLRLDRFETVPYNKATKQEIRKVFAKRTVDLQQLCMLHPWLGRKQGRMVLDSLKKWKKIGRASCRERVCKYV